MGRGRRVAGRCRAGLRRARRGSRPDALAVRQSERDEWGRRFSEAIELMTDDSAARRAMGRALVEALLGSDLAQADDRRIARALLTAAAASTVPPGAVSRTGPPRLRETRVVADAPADDAGNGPIRDQIESARLLIKISDGEQVEPWVRHIADAGT